jgi:hypothetical protein
MENDYSIFKSFQNICMSTSLIISYKLSFYFDKPVKFISVLLFFYWLYIPLCTLFQKIEKINGKRFLQIETVVRWC